MTMMTSTSVAEPAVLHPDPASLVRLLLDEGILLLPTDTVWCVACVATQAVAVHRLLRLCPPALTQPVEVLCDNLAMLRQYSPDLHPRLETLLAYHIRPLTVVNRAPATLPQPIHRPDGTVALRLTHDALCLHLIRATGQPLAVVPALRGQGPLPTSFGRVRSDIIQQVDRVVCQRQTEVLSPRLSPMVCLDDSLELTFLRD